MPIEKRATRSGGREKPTRLYLHQNTGAWLALRTSADTSTSRAVNTLIARYNAICAHSPAPGWLIDLVRASYSTHTHLPDNPALVIALAAKHGHTIDIATACAALDALELERAS